MFEHHNSSSLVIISLILMTEMFEQEMLLLGEMDVGHYFWASKVERDKVIKEAM